MQCLLNAQLSQVHKYLIYFILLSKPLALHTFILFMGNLFDSQWTRYCLNESLCTALVIPSLPCPRVVCSVFLRPSAFLLGTSSKLRKEMQRAESTGASKYWMFISIFWFWSLKTCLLFTDFLTTLSCLIFFAVVFG